MSERPSCRRIIHVDMDAFFAAVEQRDDPRLRGRPVVVGGDPRGRGVVATCSYEARRYGIHSAMPAAQAHRLCPGAVFLRPDGRRYQEVSRRLRAIFRDYTSLVEPLSLDEAFLDVTEERGGLPSATAVAREIRARIRAELALTASAGVGPVKLVAKIASDFRKPDGLTVVRPEEVEGFLAPLPVGRIWGVGPATERRMHALGIRTVGELAAAPPAVLVATFGAAWGHELSRLARGLDERPVVPHRIPKSHGAERTFERDLERAEEVRAVVGELAGEVASALAKDGRPGRTVTLKVRYDDFTTITRSLTAGELVKEPGEILESAAVLLARTEAGVRPVRLLGVSVANLVGDDEPVQIPLPFD